MMRAVLIYLIVGLAIDAFYLRHGPGPIEDSARASCVHAGIEYRPLFFWVVILLYPLVWGIPAANEAWRYGRRFIR